MCWHAQHDCVDARFGRITFEHHSLNPCNPELPVPGLPCCGNSYSASVRRFSPRSFDVVPALVVAATCGESRKLRMRVTVYAGRSSISQCPEPTTTAS